MTVHLIEESDRNTFSQQVHDYFIDTGCQVALLHFSRLVSKHLFDEMPTFNVHPSLLPAFPGLDGIRSAFDSRSLFQGASLHLVDHGMDTGSLISQTVAAVSRKEPIDWRYKLGYVQKVLMTLAFLDLVDSRSDLSGLQALLADPASGGPAGPYTNPGYLHPRFDAAAALLLSELGTRNPYPPLQTSPM